MKTTASAYHMMALILQQKRVTVSCLYLYVIKLYVNHLHTDCKRDSAFDGTGVDAPAVESDSEMALSKTCTTLSPSFT